MIKLGFSGNTWAKIQYYTTHNTANVLYRKKSTESGVTRLKFNYVSPQPSQSPPHGRHLLHANRVSEITNVLLILAPTSSKT